MVTSNRWCGTPEHYRRIQTRIHQDPYPFDSPKTICVDSNPIFVVTHPQHRILESNHNSGPPSIPNASLCKVATEPIRRSYFPKADLWTEISVDCFACSKRPFQASVVQFHFLFNPEIGCEMPVPNIIAVAEIVLNVDSISEMRTFYENTLGFEFHSDSQSVMNPEGDDSDAPTICFLKVANSDTPLGQNKHPILLALIDYKRHRFASRFRDVATRNSTLNHLAFEISPREYQSSLQHLSGLGIKTTLSDFPNVGGKAIFFDDPEGNRIELICNQDSD